MIIRALSPVCIVVVAAIGFAEEPTAKLAEQEWVQVAPDNRSFVLEKSGRKFVPWGFNYDHDGPGRLIEDYWDDEWPMIVEDFQEMKELGATVIRIHLQFGKFMVSPDKPNQHSLQQLARLVTLAEHTGLYLDLTGLGCYHKQDVPPWYDKLDEEHRWAAQAAFWEAVAKTCANSPAIFCYDLMNEPVIGGAKKRDDWLAGAFAGKHFVQFIVLETKGRPRHEIARQWTTQLVAAVRKHDRKHLVTVGLVPWSLDRPGMTSGFVPDKIADQLDFIAMHIYPEKGKVTEAMETLEGFAAVGKPVVIEETFPLKCSQDEMSRFLDESKSVAAGWISFYWGKTSGECRKGGTIGDAIMANWLEAFQEKMGSIVNGQAEPMSFLENGATAHRGNSSEYPENTIPAFASGIEVGADWIELDIFRTKDGKLVVIHDRTTGRVGDSNLAVAESTYEELAEVDVATDFRRRCGKAVEECPPQRIPLLEDVLRLVKKQDRTRVSIQPKMDCVADAVALIRSLKAERWVGFNDGNLQYMAEVKRLAPNVPVFWDRGTNTDIDEDIRIARQHAFESLVLHHEGVTPEKVQKIKAAGIKVGAWTVNDPAVMRRLTDMGIERLYTDDPRRLLSLKSGRDFHNVQCDGTYRHHLQGICTNDRDAIYWSFTTTLVKTDTTGKVLKQLPVGNHHGDLCHVDGKLYVAVNFGRFNDPKGNADSWVYVYDAGDLSLLAKHETQEAFHGAGGIGFRDGHFFVVGGLPDTVDENYVYEHDAEFKFVKRHVIKSGHTHLGIQTAAFANGQWWFGCYGDPKVLLVTDENFKMKGRYEFDCSLGIVGLPDGRLLSAGGRCEKDKGCRGNARLLTQDELLCQ